MVNEESADGASITLTREAEERLLKVFRDRDILGKGALRIEVVGRGAGGFQYDMAVEEDGEPLDDDVVIEHGDVRIFVDPESWQSLRGSRVDYVVQLAGGGFKIDNPNPVWSDPLAVGIAKLIDEQVAPGVASHGGLVNLIDVKDNVVYVRLGGGCQGCAMVDVTLRQGIEVMIKQAYPQIVGVVDTTDHAGGSNPYYTPSKGASGQSPFYQRAKG